MSNGLILAPISFPAIQIRAGSHAPESHQLIRIGNAGRWRRYQFRFLRTEYLVCEFKNTTKKAKKGLI
jgi:hypothetical protein